MTTASVPSFEVLFGYGPEGAASAPGRVNLIGEHTDYNGGFVLPIALPLRTTVEVRLRSDGLVRAFSVNVQADEAWCSYRLGQEAPGRGWIDYVQGVTKVLGDESIELTGFDLRVESSIPLGSGLSSSAALEVAVLRALRAVGGLSLDDLAIARTAHRAETEFVGAPVGVMDHVAASLGSDRAALFLDTLTLAFRPVTLPADSELAVIDSGITHHHARGEYRTRRAECGRAAELLGVDHLCALTLADLPRVAELPAPLNRRARHVVTENTRVVEAVDAIERSDTVRLGALFLESHASMRDDFEVSLPEIDRIVDIARQVRGVFGARLTGGGFGGAVVMLCDGSAAEACGRVVWRCRTEGCAGARVLLPG